VTDEVADWSGDNPVAFEAAGFFRACEGFMSIADLKVRLGDVPGIQNLTIGLEGGKIMLRWGDGYLAAAILRPPRMTLNRPKVFQPSRPTFRRDVNPFCVAVEL
jgi:hypothetical protein